ncbi:MAG TPA: prolipoprotein diacylglyceryl transferase family protein [Anaerolineales bacterium]|nr:prolipoprotein diacylglyceryl transferase family protein [Anaerolineales bacterium]
MIDLFRSLFAPPRDFILVIAALWIGLAFAERRTARHGVSRDALNNLTFYAILGYVIGGRLLFALTNYSAFVPSPLSIFSPNPELFDPIGAFVSAILVGIIYGKHMTLPFWGTLDALTPIFAILAIGLHLSHLAAGTAFGSPTDLPWGTHLWNATRHPTQIYELIASLFIFGLLWFRKSDSPQGILFLNFVALTAGSRLFLEAFRGDSTLVFGGLRIAQVVAWVVLAIALLARELMQRKKQAG